MIPHVLYISLLWIKSYLNQTHFQDSKKLKFKWTVHENTDMVVE